MLAAARAVRPSFVIVTDVPSAWPPRDVWTHVIDHVKNL
jgi:hypothetical protein